MLVFTLAHLLYDHFQFALIHGANIPLKEFYLSVYTKHKDITLPTKVHPVKAMVFPVVMYGYENWTVKKAER